MLKIRWKKQLSLRLKNSRLFLIMCGELSLDDITAGTIILPDEIEKDVEGCTPAPEYLLAGIRRKR